MAPKLAPEVGDRVLRELFDASGPVIRYRVARELLEDRALARSCRPALLGAAAVRPWLARLPEALPPLGPTRRTRRPNAARGLLALAHLHGGGDSKLETVLGKLVYLGLHAGMRELDRGVRPLRAWLRASEGPARLHPFGSFTRALVASQLALAGYLDAPEVATTLEERVQAIYRLAKTGSLDIYVAWEPPHRPNAFHRRRRLIDPALYGSRGFALPWHHDLYLFGALPERRRNASKRIRSIVELVLTPQFQALDPSYGMVALARDRFMVSGWRPALPLHDPPPGTRLLPSLMMMAPFAPAREHPWLGRAIDHLAGFGVDRDRVCFPASYVREKPGGYWPWWRMQLEAGRRTARTRTLESTFWLARIRKLARR